MHIKYDRDVFTSWPEKAGLCTLTFLATFFLIIGFASPAWVEIMPNYDQYLAHGKHIYVGLWGISECNTTTNEKGRPIQTGCAYIFGGWYQHRIWYQISQALECIALITTVLSTATTFLGTAKNLLLWRKLTIVFLLITDVGNIMALLIFRNIYSHKDEHSSIFISISVMCLAFGICFTSIAMLFNVWLLKR